MTLDETIVTRIEFDAKVCGCYRCEMIARAKRREFEEQCFENMDRPTDHPSWVHRPTNV